MRKEYLICFIIYFLLLLKVPAGAVDYFEIEFDGNALNVVEIDLDDPRILVTPMVSSSFPNAPESFESIIKRTKPLAAINGTFFSTRTFEPIGDIVINKELVYFGGLGTAMAITKDNQVEFIKVEKWHHMDWSRYMTVISAGPRLLDNGIISLNPYAEGFRDPRLFGRRNRSAAGVTYDNRLLFVTTKGEISFKELAELMRKLGCRDALNLDGGSSSALYCNNEFITRPRAAITNILAVYEVESPLKKALAESKDTEFNLFKLVMFVKSGNTFAIKTYKENQTLAELNVGEFPKFENAQLQLFSAISVESTPEGIVLKSGKENKIIVIVKPDNTGAAKIIFPFLNENLFN